MRLSIFLMQNETFRFSHSEWDFPVFSCRMRLSGFLIQNETFRFSHAGWDFLVFSFRMRFSGFLMQDETFQFPHWEWDFPVFLFRMRLFGFLMLHETFCPKDETKKKDTLLRPLHYVLAVNNRTVGFWYEIRKKYVTIFSSLSIFINTRLNLKDLKDSYSNLDVPKLKIWPFKWANFFPNFFPILHNLALIYTLCYVPKISENIG